VNNHVTGLVKLLALADVVKSP